MSNSKLNSMIYDNLMNLIVTGKIELDDLEKEIEKMKVIFSPYYLEDNLDKEALLREILFDYGVFAGSTKVLEDNTDHQEWLAEERSKINWNLWNRYKKYLEVGEKLPRTVISSIDTATDEILKRLESPRRPGPWDRRGMVVGNVQSGKTSNYIGLISKAVDAGYKIIIILAGLNNDLRSQTQKRVDKGFLGRDTRKKDSYDQTSSKIGAGLLPGFLETHVIAVTSSETNGDYKKNVHGAVTITPGGDPVIAVIKKNVTPLNNLINWFQGANSSGKIMNVPILLIDDESDNASIDTKAVKRIGIMVDPDEAEQDPTRINGLIRKILNSFSQSAYVGYTATPFANIFIYPSNSKIIGPEYGEDLFPRSFIINLHAPSNYVGPENVFGLYKDRTANIDEVEPLPLIRVANDFYKVFPEKHKPNLRVITLPESLIQAIYVFILAGAARDARGQGDKHHSMLVHVTRYVDVQAQIAELIQQLRNEIVDQLEFRTGPQYHKLMSQLKEIWESDFVPTTQSIIKSHNDNMVVEQKWSDIEPKLFHNASKIEVKAVNGKAADGGIDYDSYPSGCSVIAIGGDKLSRGLTLEGLTISYYSRMSKMYDTLLQMGRWFGYKNGYIDTCRLYTSSTLVNWYRHIAVANEELRRELDDMADLGGTPENYGLKVRTHPDGMVITAMNKMRNSEKRTVTYAGKLVQITRFYKNNGCNLKNIEFTDKWLLSLGNNTKNPSRLTHNNYIWEGIDVDKIIEFLQNVTIHHSCFNASPKVVTQYILNQNKDKELTNWTVALVSINTGESYNIGEKNIGLSWRSDQAYDDDDDTIYLIRNNLITESDQEVDLSREERAEALKQTRLNWKSNIKSKGMPSNPSPIWIRRTRKKENGLLMIYLFNSGKNENGIKDIYENLYLGYAISFPESVTAHPVEYKVDEVYLRSDLDEE